MEDPILRTDDWIEKSAEAIKDEVVTSFNRYLNDPCAKKKELIFRFLIAERHPDFVIQYPGPNGQEEIPKRRLVE